MGGAESDDELIPEPETIYERTKEEGHRRLHRPLLEEMSTALAAGFDIVGGIIVMLLLMHFTERHFGKEVAHVIGAMGFGVGFIFLVVGRGELFTENFLVPLAGLHGRPRNAWWKVAELWTVSPIFNVVAGGVHVHDLNATVLQRLGIDHTRLTFRFQGRDFRLTDVHGNVVRELLA